MGAVTDHHPPPGHGVVICGRTWPLEDPNAEDQAMGNTHRCTRPELHPTPHRCYCGATEPEP